MSELSFRIICEGCKHWKYCHGDGFTKFGMCYEPEETETGMEAKMEVEHE